MITEDDYSLSYVFAKLVAWLLAILSQAMPVVGTMLLVVFLSLSLEILNDLKDRRLMARGRFLLILSKLVVYPLIVFAGHFVQVNISPVIPWVQALSGIIIVHELKSSGKIFASLYGVNFFDAVKDYIIELGPKFKKKHPK